MNSIKSFICPVFHKLSEKIKVHQTILFVLPRLNLAVLIFQIMFATS